MSKRGLRELIFETPSFSNVKKGDHVVVDNARGELSLYPVINKTETGVVIDSRNISEIPFNQNGSYVPPTPHMKSEIPYDEAIILKRHKTRGCLVGEKIQKTRAYLFHRE